MSAILTKSGNILEFRNVSKGFPGVQALRGITFSVKRGHVHCLVGENGAGKSTLLKVINGLYRSDEGGILYDGQPWTPANSAQARDQGIAMIHQELNVIPEMTIAQNMFLGKELLQKNRLFLDDKAMCRTAAELMERQGIAYDPNTKMKQLSIAEAQMVEIIKAVSSSAKVVLMDEPTSSLTEKEVGFLFEQIQAMKERGITILYISHKMEEIFQIADDISVFRDGQHIETAPADSFTRDSIIEKMVGRKMSEVYPARKPKPGQVALRVEGLCRSGAYEDVCFEVRQGEILGVSGLVGAGRSEMARGMIGLDPVDGGQIYSLGKEVRIRSVNDSISAGIAMVSEDRRRYGLILQRDVKENASLVALKHVFKRARINLSRERKLVSDMVERLSIKTPGLETRTATLSGGNQQKVVLAKWLAVNPKVLIMDEPTRGIDVGTKYEIYKLMNRMTDEGVAIIMINSDMEELLGMSDRVLVIRQGRVAGELSRNEATAEAVMRLAVGE